MPEKNLRITVITPARTIYDADAQAIVAPAFDGELGVLPGHAAFMALLGSGTLRITQPDGSRKHLAVRGGFLQVANNVVTVLTPESVGAEELDASKLNNEIEKIKSEHAANLEQREAQAQKLAWALARRKILEAKRGESRN